MLDVKVNNNLKNLNSHLTEKTLEEEIVSNMKLPDNIPNSASYNPVQCNDHNAESI